MSRAYSMHRRDEKFIQILILEPEGKRLHGRPKHKWDKNIKVDLGEIACDNVNWSHLA
jgi:hypothetical protein